ncbi:hypothetical protein HYC85_000434 [Camellia sinensis]|uniref:Inositol polyphosphate-related phosphatase domain-containing protein n=1 Tax=Camellia sinensis TaxID=4442 RepID=A0A7J7I3B2_CAMSI|nr:hypothetical protein HYC85_000434 [Camellia sinensis]
MKDILLPCPCPHFFEIAVSVSVSASVGLEGSSAGQWWLDMVGKTLDEGSTFERVGSRQLAGLLIAVWVRNNIRGHVGDVDVAAVPCGFGRAIGNKGRLSQQRERLMQIWPIGLRRDGVSGEVRLGSSYQGAVGLRMRVYGRIMCFVNCHFAAHLEAVNRRNADFDHVYRTMIFSRPSNLFNAAAAGVSSSIQMLCGVNAMGINSVEGIPELSQADMVVFLGDFNYRLDGYDSGEKKRIPAWCDRILYRDSRSTSVSSCGSDCPVVSSISLYEACMDVTDSDHKPVRCVFSVEIARFVKDSPPSRRMDKQSNHRPRGSFGFPRWLEVSPAAGIIKPDHIVEISVRREDFQTLEEFVDGVPRNWWCEDARDKEVILVVKVRDSCTTETRSHRIRVRHSFSGKTMHMDNKDNSGHIQANVLRRSDFQRLSCSSDVVDHLRNFHSP